MNLIIVGRGGQGVVFLSDVIAESAFFNGFDVKASNILGMAQRGGTVISHIKYNTLVYSPLIRQRDADAIVILDPICIPSVLKFIRPETKVFLYSSERNPDISAKTKNLVQIAKRQDLPANTFVLGALSRELNLRENHIIKILESRPRADLNLAAFSQGAKASNSP